MQKYEILTSRYYSWSSPHYEQLVHGERWVSLEEALCAQLDPNWPEAPSRHIEKQAEILARMLEATGQINVIAHTLGVAPTHVQVKDSPQT